MTLDRFPDLVSATFGEGCEGSLWYLNDFPLLGRHDVTVKEFAEDDRDTLARLGERPWVTATEYRGRGHPRTRLTGTAAVGRAG